MNLAEREGKGVVIVKRRKSAFSIVSLFEIVFSICGENFFPLREICEKN